MTGPVRNNSDLQQQWQKFDNKAVEVRRVFHAAAPSFSCLLGSKIEAQDATRMGTAFRCACELLSETEKLRPVVQSVIGQSATAPAGGGASVAPSSSVEAGGAGAQAVARDSPHSFNLPREAAEILAEIDKTIEGMEVTSGVLLDLSQSSRRVPGQQHMADRFARAGNFALQAGALFNRVKRVIRDPQATTQSATASVDVLQDQIKKPEQERSALQDRLGKLTNTSTGGGAIVSNTMQDQKLDEVAGNLKLLIKNTEDAIHPQVSNIVQTLKILTQTTAALKPLILGASLKSNGKTNVEVLFAQFTTLRVQVMKLLEICRSKEQRLEELGKLLTGVTEGVSVERAQPTSDRESSTSTGGFAGGGAASAAPGSLTSKAVASDHQARGGFFDGISRLAEGKKVSRAQLFANRNNEEVVSVGESRQESGTAHSAGGGGGAASAASGNRTVHLQSQAGPSAERKTSSSGAGVVSAFDPKEAKIRALINDGLIDSLEAAAALLRSVKGEFTVQGVDFDEMGEAIEIAASGVTEAKRLLEEVIPGMLASRQEQRSGQADEERLEGLEGKVCELEKACGDSEQKLANSEQNLQKTREELKALQREQKEVAQAAKIQQQAQLKQLQEELATTKKELESVRQGLLSTTRTKDKMIQDKARALEQLQRENRQLQREKEELNRQVGVLDGKSKQLQQQVEELLFEQEVSNEALNAQKDGFERHIRFLRAIVTRLENEHVAMENERDEALAKVRKLSQQLEKVQPGAVGGGGGAEAQGLQQEPVLEFNPNALLEGGV